MRNLFFSKDRGWLLWGSMLAILLGPLPLLAQTKRPMNKVEKFLIEGDKKISGHVDTIAEGIDVFLARRKFPGVRNQTKVVVENSTFSAEGQGAPTNSTHLKVSLHLPNLQESWQLKFTTYNEDEEDRETKNKYLRRTPRQTNYGTSLAIFKTLGKVRTTFQPRVELADPLQVSHVLKFDTEFEMKNYKFDPKLEFFARPDKGTGFFLASNFIFPLATPFTLSFINEGEYQDKLNMFSTTNGLSLGQGLSDRTSLTYAIFFDSHNRLAYHLENYGLSVAWNHLLYKNVLHYQVVPHLDFPKNRSFKGLAGLNINVSLIF